MLGRVCYAESGKTLMRREKAGNAVFLTAYVPHGRSVRGMLYARKTAALFEQEGVHLAAFPQDYPYAKIFARRGVCPPDVTQLYRFCAAEIAHCILRQNGIAPGRAHIALVSKEVSGDLHRAARRLARTVRYLSLCSPDAERLAYELRWEYGVAAKTVSRGEALRADLAVCFDETETDGCPALSLADGSIEVSCRAALGEETCADVQLLAALAAAGELHGENLCVERVILSKAVNFP